MHAHQHKLTENKLLKFHSVSCPLCVVDLEEKYKLNMCPINGNIWKVCVNESVCMYMGQPVSTVSSLTDRNGYDPLHLTEEGKIRMTVLYTCPSLCFRRIFICLVYLPMWLFPVLLFLLLICIAAYILSCIQIILGT